ncbi:MAG TPA: hypothetical protein DEF89_11915 [Desulfosporosinus sp.]|nr:hypothetical protein [Desulfosporosinus sp.]
MCKFDDSYKLEIRSLKANNIDDERDKDKDNNDNNDSNDDNNNNEKVKDDGGDLLKALDEWCYQVYAERMEPYLEQLRNKEAVDRAPETFFMIDELEELLNSVKDIRLVPCNCRKLAERCEKPTETCLSFDASITDRTYGRSLSKDEAREIVILSHRKGLMHQINSDWREKGPTWMCNCCSCCCYPTRLAQDRGMKGIFPVIQYVAQRNEVKCSHCGACVKRCNFSAFQLGETEIMVNGKPRKRVEFDQDKCWGCGICVDSCVTKAISMVSLG